GPAVPFSGATSFTFFDHGGNATLVIHNPAGGLFAPAAGVRFDGGGQPGNSLVLDGGAAFVEDFETDPDAGSGTLFASNGSLNQVMVLASVAVVTDTTPAVALTIHDATDTASAVTLDDGATPGAGRNRVLLGATAAFEFANKAILALNTGLTTADQGKFFILAGTQAATGLSSVTINGGAGNDLVFVHGTA